MAVVCIMASVSKGMNTTKTKYGKHVILARITGADLRCLSSPTDRWGIFGLNVRPKHPFQPVNDFVGLVMTWSLN